MQLLSLLVVVAVAFSAALAAYPSCWVKSGECLDQNKGPLMVGVVPQINPNVIMAVSNVTSFDDCVSQCVDNVACR